jgi:type IV fimbrial biogenesis protein FimT
MFRQTGASLIELMVAVTIFAILLALGIPNMQDWMQNMQIRTAGESTLAGLHFARGEAIKRNALVRYQLVSTLDNTCVLNAAGPHSIVSLDDPTGACSATVDDTVAPRILQVRPAAEGSRNVALAADGTTVMFNGLGRTIPGGLSTIDLSNPVGGACQHVDNAAPMRCLRARISVGGEVRLCDPKVGDNTDPRFC